MLAAVDAAVKRLRNALEALEEFQRWSHKQKLRRAPFPLHLIWQLARVAYRRRVRIVWRKTLTPDQVVERYKSSRSPSYRDGYDFFDWGDNLPPAEKVLDPSPDEALLGPLHRGRRKGRITRVQGVLPP